MKSNIWKAYYGLSTFATLLIPVPALAQYGGSIAGLLDTIYRTPDVFYLGADQHVHILGFNGSWHTTDVTADAGAPYATPAAGLSTLLDTVHRTLDVFYMGEDGDVHILYFNNSWQTTDVTADAGAPSTGFVYALSSLLDTTRGTPDVFYLGDDFHVHILYFNGSWHTMDATADAGAPYASGSGLTSLFDTISGRNTADVFYLATDQHVHILGFSGSWHTTDVTARAGAPNARAGSTLTSLLDTTRGTLDVFYLGNDDHVHVLYFNDSWHTMDATADAGAPDANGSVLTSLFDTISGRNTADVFYLATDQHVHILGFNGSWHRTDVTARAGAPNPNVSILADLFDTIYRRLDVFYLGADQHVHILYFDNSWHTADVTSAAGAPPAGEWFNF
jgi:hypothetical protein